MPDFREITGVGMRGIDRMLRGMEELDDLHELERRMISEAPVLLEAENLAWNNWAPDWSGLISGSLTDSYMGRFASLLGTFSEVVGHHPILSAGEHRRSHTEVLRLSDFQSYGKFRKNPLFREVYRHLDSHFQLCHTPCRLADRLILLNLNRRSRDFTERDRQMLHYLGLKLDPLVRRVEQREHLQRAWNGLSDFVGSMGSGELASLGDHQVRILSDLLHHPSRESIARLRGIRRDTLDKKLGVIRERLGLENHHQLLSALSDMHARNHATPQERSDFASEDSQG